MSSARNSLLRLCEQLSRFENVTHWAISMRCFGKGDYFDRLMRGSHPRTDTYERALQWFSDHWPEDLEWPRDIQRPVQKKGAA